jgi:hypothetical protein
LLAVTILLTIAMSAQETRKAVPMTAAGRLTAAKTAYLKYGGGSRIPFKVIDSALEGWGRFSIVSDSEKADIVFEVSAPEMESGVSVSSSTNGGPLAGRNERSTSTSKAVTVPQVKLVVFDARSKLPLWTGTERPKPALKQKGREDNLVEATQHLFTRFRDQVEGTAAP